MNNITIRRYNPTDLEQCRILWAELVQHHREIYNDHTIGGENPGLEFDDHLNRIGAENIWVAEDREEEVGFFGLDLKGQEPEIEPVVVSSKCRNRGIGHTLIRHAIEEAKRMNVPILAVRPVIRNSQAISFFFKSGFRKLGHIQMFMYLNETECDYWKAGLELLGHSFEY